jgi:hypothetical protein
VRHLRCGADACYGEIEFIDRVSPVAGEILDRAADGTGLGREPDGFSSRVGGVREAVLKIGIHREISRRDDCSAIGDHLGAAHVADSTAEHVRQSATRGGQRFESRLHGAPLRLRCENELVT